MHIIISFSFWYNICFHKSWWKESRPSTKKCYIGRDKCREAYPAKFILQISKAKYVHNTFFAGFELLSYLRGKPSIVVTGIWPQRALRIYQSQDPVGDGTDHHCRLLGAVRWQWARWRSAEGGCGDPNTTSELHKALRIGDFPNHRETPSSTGFQLRAGHVSAMKPLKLALLGIYSWGLAEGGEAAGNCCSVAGSAYASKRKTKPNDILLLGC